MVFGYFFNLINKRSGILFVLCIAGFIAGSNFPITKHLLTEQKDLNNRYTRTWYDAANNIYKSVSLNGTTLNLDNGKPVNAAIKRVDNETFSGWQVSDVPIPFTLADDGLVSLTPGDKYITEKLDSVGYLHPATNQFEEIQGKPTYTPNNVSFDTQTRKVGPEKQILQTDITWTNVWNGINILWKVSGLGVQEKVLVQQNFRTTISQNQQPDSWFGFRFILDLPEQDKARLLKSENGKDWEIRGIDDELLALLPVDYAYVIESPGKNGHYQQKHWKQLNKKLYTENGNTYLFVGLSPDDLASLPPGELIIDPSWQVDDTSQDAYSQSAAAAVSGTEGTHTLPSTSIYGAFYLGYEAGATENYEGGWIFETTIPQGATITSADVTLTAGSDNTGNLTGGWWGYAVDTPTNFSRTTNTLRVSDWATRTTANVTHNFTATSGTVSSPSISAIIQEIVDRGGFSGTLGVTYRNTAVSGAVWQSWQDYSDSPGNAAVLDVEYTTDTDTEIDQEGFRFRNDDGDEDEATWIASQDTNINRPSNTNTRLRMLLNATENPDTAQYQLEYKKSTDENYTKVSVGPTSRTITEVITTSATWQAPYEVSSATIQAWGGGGAGGGKQNNGGGGGGGGGAYAESTLSITPGTDYPVVVGTATAVGSGNGANGTPTSFDTSTVVAAGGSGGGGGAGAPETGGAGGTTGSSTGTITRSGGNGGNTFLGTDGGAGGGEAAGSTSNGANGGNGSSTGVAGSAGAGNNADGGDGGAGSANSAASAPSGNAPGGGGGGAYRLNTNRNGGAGARGEVQVTYNTDQLSFNNSGAVAAGTTSLSIPYPTGIAEGDLLVLCIGNKHSTTSPTTPADWTALPNNQTSGAVGANTADAGSTVATVLLKEADGTETGNVSVSIPSGNASLGRIFRYSKASNTSWSFITTYGSDNTGNQTSWSATAAADPGISGGDILVTCSAANTDAYTYNSQTVTATGVTISNGIERQDSSTANGNDMALIASQHLALSGDSSAAPVFTMTSSGFAASSPGGATVLLRLRQVEQPIQLIDSSNISASGQNTTSQLAAPTGKTSSDFIAGRMQDDENPADTIDISTDDYTELEWNLTVSDAASNEDVYQFRVTAAGTPIDTYSVTPQLTVNNVTISVSLNTDGTISYGTLGFGESKSTVTLTDTQIAENDGSATQDFNIKTSAATGGTEWTLGDLPGTDIFVHEFSTNGGSDWTSFITADSYQTLATGIAASDTQSFDLRITAPNPSSDAIQKTITITIQAVEP